MLSVGNENCVYDPDMSSLNCKYKQGKFVMLEINIKVNVKQPFSHSTRDFKGEW